MISKKCKNKNVAVVLKVIQVFDLLNITETGER